MSKIEAYRRISSGHLGTLESWSSHGPVANISAGGSHQNEASVSMPLSHFKPSIYWTRQFRSPKKVCLAIQSRNTSYDTFQGQEETEQIEAQYSAVSGLNMHLLQCLNSLLGLKLVF